MAGERHGNSRMGEGMSISPIDPNLPLGMTRDIVIAEISNNHVPPEALPSLIQEVYDTLCRIAADAAVRAGVTPAREPSSAAAAERSEDDAEAGPRPAGQATDGTRPRTAREEGRTPAAPREASVFPDYIVCLFDGVKRKMLKRHIRSRYGMSPEAYRQYWELPDDYPMVAPNYSDEKREYAIATSFGTSRDKGRRKRGSRAA
jgi:predicted transcriptional regulator